MMKPLRFPANAYRHALTEIDEAVAIVSSLSTMDMIRENTEIYVRVFLMWAYIN